MIYVISEDEGSGLSFWKMFFETYVKEYQIITLEKNAGNLTLENQLDAALQEAVKDDVVFIAFDKVFSTSGFDTGDFLNIAKEKCIRKGVSLFVTKYYCFEEIYLSYPELEDMIRKDGKKTEFADVAQYIYSKIQNDEDYFNSDEPAIKVIVNQRKDALKNREHFADAALYSLTRTIRNGYFTIDKSKKNGLNKCWTMACDDIRQRTRKDMTYTCNNCAFSKKECASKDKLDDLCERSCLVEVNKGEVLTLFAVEI